MNRSLPLIPLLILPFSSCREEAPDLSVNTNPAPVAMERMELKLAELENEILREKSERLEKDSEQRALLLEIRDLVERQDQILVEEADKPEPEATGKVGVPAIKEVEKKSKLEKEAEARETARLEAVGETYQELTTLSGELYQDLEITQATDLGVIFRHRSGVARIPFSDLPKEWGDRFFHDPERAQRAARNERLAQARRDQAIAREALALREQAQTEAADARLALLAEAVDDLRRRDNDRDANRFAAGGAFINPPFFAQNQFGFWDGFFCPPVVQPQVINPPVIRNSHQPSGIIRNNPRSGVGVGSTRVQRPQVQPVPRSRPTIQRVTPSVIRPASSRARSGSTGVSRPRTTVTPRTSRTTVTPRTSTRTVRPATGSRSGGSSKVYRRTR